MQAQAMSVFGGRHFLEVSGITSVVSPPMPMVGNRVQLVAEVYSFSGTPVLDVQLEGTVLGQVWEEIGAGFSTTPTIGGFPADGSGAYAVTYAVVRVRVTISGSSAKAWFDVGLSMTEQ